MLATESPPLKAKLPVRLGLVLRSKGAGVPVCHIPTATPLAMLSAVSRSKRGSSGSTPEPPLAAVKVALTRVKPFIGPGHVTTNTKSLPWLTHVLPGWSWVMGTSPKSRRMSLPLPVAAPVAATVQVGAVMMALKLTIPVLACTGVASG